MATKDARYLMSGGWLIRTIFWIGGWIGTAATCRYAAMFYLSILIPDMVGSNFLHRVHQAQMFRNSVVSFVRGEVVHFEVENEPPSTEMASALSGWSPGRYIGNDMQAEVALKDNEKLLEGVASGAYAGTKSKPRKGGSRIIEEDLPPDPPQKPRTAKNLLPDSKAYVRAFVNGGVKWVERSLDLSSRDRERREELR